MSKRIKEVLIIALVVYFFGLINSFFSYEEAYIYDAESDKVFYVKQVPNFNHCDKWLVFMPFKKCPAYLPVDTQFLFKLTDLKDLQVLNKKYEELDYKKYHEKLIEKNNIAYENIKKGIFKAEDQDKAAGTSWDFSIFNLRKLTHAELPNILAIMYLTEKEFENFDGGLSEIVFVKTNWKNPIEPEIVKSKKAILLRGKSAEKFVNYVDVELRTLREYNQDDLLSLEEMGLSN